MSKKLKDLFAGKNLQEAADAILSVPETPEARLALLNQFIAGEVNPSFEQSEKILAWAKKEKKASDTGVPKSRTVTTCAGLPRRPVAGMTW